MKRFAVTSTDGKKVNEPFELAETFFIYESDGINMKFVEKRTSTRYSYSAYNTRFKRNRFKLIYEKIKDCSVLVTKDIGEITNQKISEYGIKIFKSDADIASAF